MRKIIKRSVVVLLAGVLLFSLSGCKKKQKKDEVQRYAWPLGTSSPEDTVTQLYAEKFAKEVSRLSHGKMKIAQKAMPLIVCFLVALLLITFIPQISLALL